MVSHTTGLKDFVSGFVVVTTISDLYEQTESGDFYVPANINGIDCSGDWFYVSCKSPGCNKKLTEKDGLLICSKCDRKWQQGTYKFKILVRVFGTTGEAPFLMWDKEVSQLVGVSPAALVDSFKKEGDVLPPELESIIGMKMVFKIAIRNDNKYNQPASFNVMGVINDEHVVSTYCTALDAYEEKDLLSKMIEEDGDSDLDLDASEGDEVNSPNNGVKQVPNETTLDDYSSITKRSLLDQFSSTQNLKKGRVSCMKKEKLP
nr:putative transposase [Ipomoea batatas]